MRLGVLKKMLNVTTTARYFCKYCLKTWIFGKNQKNAVFVTKKFMLTNNDQLTNIFTSIMLSIDTKLKNRNFRLSRKRHEKCRKNTEK